MLRAATALEGWRLVNPLPRQNFVGGVLVAQALRLSCRTRSCLLAFEAPRRIYLQPARGFVAAPIAAVPKCRRVMPAVIVSILDILVGTG